MRVHWGALCCEFDLFAHLNNGICERAVDGFVYPFIILYLAGDGRHGENTSESRGKSFTRVSRRHFKVGSGIRGVGPDHVASIAQSCSLEEVTDRAREALASKHIIESRGLTQSITSFPSIMRSGSNNGSSFHHSS